MFYLLLLRCKDTNECYSPGKQKWAGNWKLEILCKSPILISIIGIFQILKLKLQYFGPPHVKSWLTGKDSDAGRDWGQEEKGMTEDEMAGWHHWLDGRESEWTLGVGDGQGGLACCDSWDRKESDMTEWLNWTEYFIGVFLSDFLHSV